MSQNVPDVSPAGIEMHGDDYPQLVSTCIKNVPVAHLIDAVKSRFQFCEVSKPTPFHHPIPTPQSTGAIGIFPFCLDYPFAGDDTHTDKYIST